MLIKNKMILAQYTLSNASSKGVNISTASTCNTARSSAELSMNWREIDDTTLSENGDQSTRLSTNASTSSDCVGMFSILFFIYFIRDS